MSFTHRALKQQSYPPIFHAMQRFTTLRTSNTPDEIWSLEHEPVYTQGMAGKPEHLLHPNHIPIVHVDRGGQITYHGPGQLVVYFLLDVNRRKLLARQLVTKIEEACVKFLASYGLEAYARQDAPGIYLNHAKIASLGLRVRNGASYHGLALNVNMDLAPFQAINPCGLAGMKMIQMADFIPNIRMADVEENFITLLKEIF